jgi:hypothetical protein
MDEKNTLLKDEFLKLKEKVEPHIQSGGTKQKNHLQSYLFFSCYPLFSFVESIIILCENGKFQTSESLLRSLIELHINVIYFQVAESDLRLAVSVKKEFDEKIKGIREIKELIRKYPSLREEDPKRLFSTEWLDKAESWAETERQAVLKGNNLDKDVKELSLKDKAIKCDQAGMKDVEYGHFERIYHVMYRQLSPSTHLNIGGIQGFVNQREDGQYLFSDGDQKSYYLMQTAIDICVALTKDLYEHKVIEGDLPENIMTLEKLLSTHSEERQKQD